MTPTDLHLTVAHQANELRLAKELIADQQRMLLKLKDDLAQVKAELAAAKAERAASVEFVEDYTPPAADAAPSEGG